MHEPVMEGGGFYNQHSELQARSAEEADGMLERALAAITLPPGPLTIADFGSSQGHNSMRQMALVLDRLTKHTGQSRDIMVVHTDLPHNDFTSLFEMLETAPDSYRRGRDHVFSVCHWPLLLRAAAAGRQPCVRLVGLRDSLDERVAADEAISLAEVAAADWRSFLTHRA